MVESCVPTMLTIKETAKRSGLAEHHVRQLCKQDKIRYVRAGSKYLVNIEMFVAFLNDGEARPLYV